jgi:hypothetical protein
MYSLAGRAAQFDAVSQPEYHLLESAMKNSILRILISVILFSLMAGIVVSIIGLMLGWKTSTQFSDGIFWVGIIMIGIGYISYSGYNQRASDGPSVYANPVNRSKLWDADASRGKTYMAVLGISGFLLIGLSILVGRLF